MGKVCLAGRRDIFNLDVTDEEPCGRRWKSQLNCSIDTAVCINGTAVFGSDITTKGLQGLISVLLSLKNLLKKLPN